MELSDIHSHILPGLDDGVRTIEETMQVLRNAQKQKISKMMSWKRFWSIILNVFYQIKWYENIGNVEIKVWWRKCRG